MPRKRYFWKNLIINLGGVNQHEGGESYSELYFFFKFNGTHVYISMTDFIIKLLKKRLRSISVQYSRHYIRLTISLKNKTFRCWTKIGLTAPPPTPLSLSLSLSLSLCEIPCLCTKTVNRTFTVPMIQLLQRSAKYAQTRFYSIASCLLTFYSIASCLTYMHRR